jgi:sarcosine oxidase subunit alpha
VTLRFNGRAVEAYEGETVGAALHADGERVLMRSIKYHRPRGLFCNAGKCASCLVRVDGTPNVRACVTPVHDGMVVETQNAFPSARRDFYAIVDKVYPRVLDVHDQFARVPFLRPLHHAIVRRMAGFGTLPSLRPVKDRRPAIRRLDADVLVVGAGPAGLGAAVAAAEGAARVVLVDEGDRAGGTLLLHRDAVAGKDGTAVADELLQRFHEAGGVLLTRSTAFGVYLTDGHGDLLPPPGLVAILTPERVVEVRPRALVVATGHHETPPLLRGNDLPGIMGARAALVLLHRHAILPGNRVIVTDPTGLGAKAAEDLAKAGAEIVGIVGQGAWKGARLVEAHGSDRVTAVTLEQDGRSWKETCNLVVSAGNETPRSELAQQAGARLRAHGFSLAPDTGKDGATTVPGVFAVGEVTASAPLPVLLAAGEDVGEAAARHARSAPKGAGA